MKVIRGYYNYIFDYNTFSPRQPATIMNSSLSVLFICSFIFITNRFEANAVLVEYPRKCSFRLRVTYWHWSLAKHTWTYCSKHIQSCTCVQISVNKLTLKNTGHTSCFTKAVCGWWSVDLCSGRWWAGELVSRWAGDTRRGPPPARRPCPGPGPGYPSPAAAADTTSTSRHGPHATTAAVLPARARRRAPADTDRGRTADSAQTGGSRATDGLRRVHRPYFNRKLRFTSDFSAVTESLVRVDWWLSVRQSGYSQWETWSLRVCGQLRDISECVSLDWGEQSVAGWVNSSATSRDRSRVVMATNNRLDHVMQIVQHDTR